MEVCRQHGSFTQHSEVVQQDMEEVDQHPQLEDNLRLVVECLLRLHANHQLQVECHQDGLVDSINFQRDQTVWRVWMGRLSHKPYILLAEAAFVSVFLCSDLAKTQPQRGLCGLG